MNRLLVRNVITAGVFFAIMAGGCRHADVTDPHDHTYVTHEISGLLSITGTWSTLGTTGNEAARMAIQDVLVISPSSTAGSLAIADDNILRLCPSDRQEGPAIVAMMRAECRTVVHTV